MYNNEHSVAKLNQSTDALTSTYVGDRPKTPDKDLQNRTHKSYTFWGNCWKCGEFGHSAKECQNNTVTVNQDESLITMFKNSQNGPTNSQTVEPIRYPITISPTRLLVLTQQITAYFQLSQEKRPGTS